MNNFIYSYTNEQAIEDGTLYNFGKLLDGTNVLATTGVFDQKGLGFSKKEDDYMFENGVLFRIGQEYSKLPEESKDGENDKHFFSIEFRKVKYFVADNGNGLTVMLPEEY